VFCADVLRTLLKTRWL